MKTITKTRLDIFVPNGKPTLVIDMDEVCCHFVLAACIETNKRTGGNLKPEDVTDWVMGKFGIERTDWQKPGFFRNLEPISGAVETLYKWRNDYNISIATDCMGVDFVQKEKQEWINEHVPFIKNVYFLSNKSVVPGDLLFDDAPHHLDNWPRIKVKMVTPYNKDTEADHEVENWKQFDKILKKGIL